MNPDPTHMVTRDEDEGCWAVQRIRDGKLVATELDLEAANALCRSYNGKATILVGVEHLQYAVPAHA